MTCCSVPNSWKQLDFFFFFINLWETWKLPEAGKQLECMCEMRHRIPEENAFQLTWHWLADSCRGVFGGRGDLVYQSGHAYTSGTETRVPPPVLAPE